MSSLETFEDILGESSDPLDSAYWQARIEAAWPLNSTSLAYESVRVVKAGAGILFGFSGFSSNEDSQFILVFDQQGGVPASGAIPKIVINVAATTDFSASYIPHGRMFRQGIVIANSSTGPTYTAGTTDTWFDVQYI